MSRILSTEISLEQLKKHLAEQKIQHENSRSEMEEMEALLHVKLLEQTNSRLEQFGKAVDQLHNQLERLNNSFTDEAKSNKVLAASVRRYSRSMTVLSLLLIAASGGVVYVGSLQQKVALVGGTHSSRAAFTQTAPAAPLIVAPSAPVWEQPAQPAVVAAPAAESAVEPAQSASSTGDQDFAPPAIVLFSKPVPPAAAQPEPVEPVQESAAVSETPAAKEAPSPVAELPKKDAMRTFHPLSGAGLFMRPSPNIAVSPVAKAPENAAPVVAQQAPKASSTEETLWVPKELEPLAELPASSWVLESAPTDMWIPTELEWTQGDSPVVTSGIDSQ